MKYFFTLLLFSTSCLATAVDEISVQTILNEYGFENLEQKTFFLQYTILHEAAEKGDLEAVRVLVQAGMDLQVKNRFETTPLHLAAEQAHLNVVKFLIGAGASINAVNTMNQTALDYAYKYFNGGDVIKYLRSQGAKGRW